MRPRHDPPLSPDDRRRDLARVLAAGLLRHQQALRRTTGSTPTNLADSAPAGLESVAVSRLSVHTG